MYRHRDAFFPMYRAGSGLLWRLQQSPLVWRHLSSPLLLALPGIAFLVHKTLVTAIIMHMVARENARLLFTARILNLLFRPFVLSREPVTTRIYFQALVRCNELERLIWELRAGETLPSSEANKHIGRGLLRANHIDRAAYYLNVARQQHPHDWQTLRLIGRCASLQGDYILARHCFKQSVALYPASVMAHQNYAARYDMDAYQPQPWELSEAGSLLICDTLCQHAEELATMQGKFKEGLAVYAQWLAYQAQIAVGKSLPAALQKTLADLSPRFNPNLPTRILPYEWVTQIGHFGSLDAYLKRTMLGEVPPANHVLLAPKKKVCNQAALACFDDLLTVVRDEALIDQLFPYQRYFGECFRATNGPNGPEDWTRAAARAQIQWDHEQRAPLLTINAQNDARGRDALRQLGLPDGAWFVGLHVREGGFYKESKGATNDYRNANIEDCYDAIREITARGGYVIRLGDPSMRKLPPMERVIDYPHSACKSDAMDMFLFANARFIIGTTSGLTSMAQAFGTPMLLINAISNDWQFWHANTAFMLKRLWSRLEKRYLSIHETFSQPLHGTLIQSHLIERLGYEPHPNTPDEITQAVREKLDRIEGRQPRIDPTHPLMQRYAEEIAHEPWMFGAAVPALAFLEKEDALGILAAHTAKVAS